MKSPGKAASGSGFGGDTGRQRLPAAGECPAGRDSWDPLQLSASSGKTAQASDGSFLLRGGSLGLALPQLCRLPGRHSSDLSAGDGDGGSAVGGHRRSVAPAGFFHILAVSCRSLAMDPVSMEKIFGFFKNFVCICGKMGYNREYENLEITKKAEKGNP